MTTRRKSNPILTLLFQLRDLSMHNFIAIIGRGWPIQRYLTNANILPLIPRYYHTVYQNLCIRQLNHPFFHPTILRYRLDKVLLKALDLTKSLFQDGNASKRLRWHKRWNKTSFFTIQITWPDSRINISIGRT